MSHGLRIKQNAVFAGVILTFIIFFSTLPQVAYTAELPGKGITVRPAQSTHDGRFQMEIVILGLKQLGYNVENMKMMTPPAGYTAVAQGDMDFWAENWEPIHNVYVEKAGGTDKMTALGVLIDGCLQGYLIDKRTAEKFNITNVAQLRDQKIAKLFDTDRDGKANLAGCPPGWGCERAIEHHMDAYKLRSSVNHDQGEFVALRTDVVTRYKAGEPVLFYTYTPLWLTQTLVPGKDVQWLEVPFTSLPAEETKGDVQTKLPDGRNLGFTVVKVRITANNKFIAANPAAKRWFELVSIPIKDINAENLLVFKGEDSFEAIRTHAKNWVSDNQAQFDAWIEEAKKDSPLDMKAGLW